MNKEEKNKIIRELEEMLNENSNFYLADISGLNAEQNSALRRLCYKREVSLKVVKNTLLRKNQVQRGHPEHYIWLFGSKIVNFGQ